MTIKNRHHFLEHCREAIDSQELIFQRAQNILKFSDALIDFELLNVIVTRLILANHNDTLTNIF